MTALHEEQIASPAVPVAPRPPALQLVTHLHTWRLIADEYDEYGYVRLYECEVCEAVRYS